MSGGSTIPFYSALSLRLPLVFVCFCAASYLASRGENLLGMVVRRALGGATLGAVGGVGGGIKGAIDNVVNGIKRGVQKKVDDIKSTPGRIASGIKAGINARVEAVKAIPGNTAKALQKRAQDTAEEIKVRPTYRQKSGGDYRTQGVASTVESTVTVMDTSPPLLPDAWIPFPPRSIQLTRPPPPSLKRLKIQTGHPRSHGRGGGALGECHGERDRRHPRPHRGRRQPRRLRIRRSHDQRRDRDRRVDQARPYRAHRQGDWQGPLGPGAQAPAARRPSSRRDPACRRALPAQPRRPCCPVH